MVFGVDTQRSLDVVGLNRFGADGHAQLIRYFAQFNRFSRFSLVFLVHRYGVKW